MKSTVYRPPIKIAFSRREIALLTSALDYRKADLVGLHRLYSLPGFAADQERVARQVEELDQLRAKVSPEITPAKMSTVT